MPRFESRGLLPLFDAAAHHPVDRLISSGRGRQRGTARTAKAGSRRAGLSASAAEKACTGGRLSRDRDVPLLPRRQRPDQGDNPPDNGPTGEQVQNQDSREVRPVARQIGGEKIEKQRNQHENRVEMEKGDEPQGRTQHATRSAKTHPIFYHGFTPFEHRSEWERQPGAPPVPAGSRLRHATCLFPCDVFYCLPRRDSSLSVLRPAW